ncbi:MAG: GIY-YIG nuclease family protein [Erysipelotrichaceae bacterium]|nr:GIY-YIG nuclease family protein [Erysipelotrichaceae bacterium]
MVKGVVYILTNPSFPDYVKIGYAADIEKRLKQLNKSETIPFAFRVYAVYEVDKSLTDKELHKLIDTLNPDLRSIETFDGRARVKEFYAMSAEDAYGLLECIARISGTEDRLKRMKPEGHEILDMQIAKEVQENEFRGKFRFTDIGIPVGSILKLLGKPEVEVKVVDDRHVEYQGKTTSLSALAKELNNFNYPVNGAKHFTYNGKTVWEIRRTHSILD